MSAPLSPLICSAIPACSLPRLPFRYKTLNTMVYREFWGCTLVAFPFLVLFSVRPISGSLCPSLPPLTQILRLEFYPPCKLTQCILVFFVIPPALLLCMGIPSIGAVLCNFRIWGGSCPRCISRVSNLRILGSCIRKISLKYFYCVFAGIHWSPGVLLRLQLAPIILNVCLPGGMGDSR